MKRYRKLWNVMYLPLIAIGSTMTVLMQVLNFKSDESRKRFRFAETATWSIQSLGAVIYNVTGFFQD